MQRPIACGLPGDLGGQMSVSTKVFEYGKAQEARMGKRKPVVGEVIPEQSTNSFIDRSELSFKKTLILASK